MPVACGSGPVTKLGVAVTAALTGATPNAAISTRRQDEADTLTIPLLKTPAGRLSCQPGRHPRERLNDRTGGGVLLAASLRDGEARAERLGNGIRAIAGDGEPGA